jgi:hypothetical protein
VHVRPLRYLAATTLALLLGCGGGSGAPDGGGTGNTNVTGQVLDGFGQPLSGRTVLVGGTATTTDANGQFTAKVSTPYDVVIIEPSPEKVATVYAQLTRTDPKLLDIGANASSTRNASVGGAITGGDAFPTSANTVSAVSWGSPESSTGAYVGSSPYSLNVDWSGPTTTTGTVHGLQWTIDDNGTVTGYRSHGTRSGIALAASSTVTNADLALTAPQTGNVSVNVTTPAGHVIAERDVYLTFADGAYFPVSADGLDAGALSVPVPSGIGATAIVLVAAVESNAGTVSTAQLSGLQPGTSGAALSLPAPAVITAPADGATGVDTSTDIVWTPVANGIHVLFLTGTANDPTYIIVSGGSRTRIPNLSAQGLGLPTGHSYDFGLVGIGPYASVDAFAQSGAIPREGVGFRTESQTSFTTK